MVIMNSKNLLPAFTLAEVLVAMLIMSLFFMATSKVMSIKQKPIFQEYPHGYYECYNNGGLKEHRVDGGTETITMNTPVGMCNFFAPKGLPIFNINVVHPNKGFYTTTETQVTSDNAIQFAGADAVFDMYANTMDTEKERQDQFMPSNLYSRFEQFRNYLKNSYPQSALGSSWRANSSAPPFSAVFIVW